VELLAYIKELLLLNDCVIIPGFGGFVTNYKEAGLHASLFSPPGKSVSFNRKLNFNDGLFINHVASEEGLNYIVARRKVEQMVQELNYRLTDGEKISIPGLGDIHYDEQQHLVFTPNIVDNLNVDAFGLSAFSYESLFSRQVARKTISHQDRQAIEVIFQKRSLKKVLVAVPLLFALAVIPLKNNTTHLQKSDLSNIREMMMPTQTPSIGKETIGSEEKNEGAADLTTGSNQSEMTPYEAPARYFLIVGSFRSEENALSFINQLVEKGYQGTDLGVIKGLHYISLGGFTNVDDALSARADYEEETEAGSWIYKKLD